MKNRVNITQEKRTNLQPTENTGDIQKSLRTKIWTLRFLREDGFLIGMINVRNQKDIYRVSELMYNLSPRLVSVDVEMNYKLDE